ncbi:hypothetical protein DPEC_G00173040 [Dallia pectoralis]|uniref:Uncharacterized protein n=1 Tax=Dallia pectoralis TaxID=75939 RepID=A0ACC2GE28_DALPE|nr:hypothetical protein DPEC_G00173040 [Dallia pectoralis]
MCKEIYRKETGDEKRQAGKEGESGDEHDEKTRIWKHLDPRKSERPSQVEEEWRRLIPGIGLFCHTMATPTPLTLLLLAAVATVAQSVGEENDLKYGYWNYREGAENVNVASVRSITRVLDVWGKRIFNDIKTLLHSQPTSLLPDYSRVRHLSESVNDLFREVSLLHRRITELTHRLATLEPLIRRYGYREEGEDGGGGVGSALAQQNTSGEGAKYPVRYTVKRVVPVRGTRVVQRRRVKVQNNGQVRLMESAER